MIKDIKEITQILLDIRDVVYTDPNQFDNENKIRLIKDVLETSGYPQDIPQRNKIYEIINKYSQGIVISPFF